VTLTAAISADGPDPAGGTVDFWEGGRLLGTGIVDPMTSRATLTTSELSTGTHNLSASFEGTATFANSESPVIVQQVDQLPSELYAAPAIVRASPLHAYAMKLTVRLTSAGVPLANQRIDFYPKEVYPTILCSSTTNADGYAACEPGAARYADILRTGGYRASFIPGTARYRYAYASAALTG
jgi:hypothetical protein